MRDWNTPISTNFFASHSGCYVPKRDWNREEPAIRVLDKEVVMFLKGIETIQNRNIEQVGVYLLLCS